MNNKLKYCPLSNIPLNIEVKVVSINNNLSNRERLFEMGFIPGSIIIPVHVSPFGDPIAYCIKGSIIALRKEDSNNIIVETEEV